MFIEKFPPSCLQKVYPTLTSTNILKSFCPILKIKFLWFCLPVHRRSSLLLLPTMTWHLLSSLPFLSSAHCHLSSASTSPENQLSQKFAVAPYPPPPAHFASSFCCCTWPCQLCPHNYLWFQAHHFFLALLSSDCLFSGLLPWPFPPDIDSAPFFVTLIAPPGDNQAQIFKFRHT